MRIFITGATGFVGTHVIERLSHTQHELYCLVRETSRVDYLKELGINLIIGDLRDKESLCRGIQGCDCVISMADYHSFWAPNRQIYFDINVKGFQNLIECALETKVIKFIHLSNALVYNGKPDKYFHLSEYARTKHAGDELAWQMYKEKQLPLTIIYSGNVVGPNDPNSTGEHIRNLIYRRVRVRAFDKVITTYIYVKDLAESILKAIESKDNIGEQYLLGKYQYSLADYNQIISRISGVPLAKLTIPDFVAVFGSKLLTLLADITKKPPLLGLSSDALRTAKAGLIFDGKQAEKSLGITYTSIETALEEAIASYKK